MRTVLNQQVSNKNDDAVTVANMEGNTLYIYDYIADNKWYSDDTVVTASDFVSNLAKVTGDITVRINSKGGEVGNALAIYQQLKDHQGKVTCVVDGYAYSCAAWILLAGEERLINTGGLVMVHNPIMYVRLDSENSFDKYMPQWKAHRDAINLIISERTGMPSNKVTDMMNAETFMTSKQAVENGFCTGIKNTLASIPSSVGNSVPENLRKEINVSNSSVEILKLRSRGAFLTKF